MKVEDERRARELGTEHWEWFQRVVGHVAIDFFIHGYKHGQDSKDKKDGTTTASD